MRAKAGVTLVVLLVVCLAQGSSLKAQGTAFVRGRVLNTQGAPVPRVKVTIAPRWAYTDAAGRFVLSRVPRGTHTIVLERGARRVTAGGVEVRGPLTNVPDLRF